MIRPGETSRSRASSSRVSQSSRTAPSGRRPRTRCSPDVRRHGSERDRRREAPQRVELLARPLVLAGLHQLGGEHVAQLDEDLDVESGVLQPRSGQRPGRPVGCGVLLLHRVAQQGLDQRGQADPRVAQQPPGELGVEQRRRDQPDLGEAGEVLGGGVQDPLGALERPPGAGRGSRSRSGRPGTCRRPRGGAGSGRRARSSGSPTRARRRWRPGRWRRARARQASTRPGGVSVSGGRPSRRESSGAGGAGRAARVPRPAYGVRRRRLAVGRSGRRGGGVGAHRQ